MAYIWKTDISSLLGSMLAQQNIRDEMSKETDTQGLPEGKRQGRGKGEWQELRM